ncbi:DNA polymerase III subunit tau [Planctomycetes bacterium Pla163]|uniref:DNA polymerase III subunit tau n=1 Tax=Rohdeia mirabilis TaxID=2528008 RepID=A0A518D0B7_9BACT|nr:DNA polymerase III subunit tau [Planctomycetes bacterium Pla163]
MDIVEPIGHADVVRGLWRAAAAERLSHALCFCGPRGVGKFTAALWFTAGLLCHAGPPTGDGAAPCGTCPSCKKLASGGWQGNHPDLMRIDPVEYRDPKEKEPVVQLSIYWIRAAKDRKPEHPETTIEEFLSLRPVESERRVVLIREAERLSLEAQNALLKTLEEPNPGTTLVLETSRFEALLPTVRSRLVQVRLAGLDESAARTVFDTLARDGRLGSDVRGDALLAIGGNAPGLALEAIEQGLVPMRAELVAVLTGRSRPTPALETLWKIDAEFPGRTARMKSVERVRAASRLVGTLLVDLRRLRIGESNLQHKDLVEQLAPVAARATDGDLVAAVQAAADAVQDTERHLDPAGALERLVRALAAVGSRRPARA